jgi:hypothetical protein
LMDSILSNSCEQICISFSTPPPEQSEIFKQEKSGAKNVVSICLTVQLPPVKFPVSCFFKSTEFFFLQCWG